MALNVYGDTLLIGSGHDFRLGQKTSLFNSIRRRSPSEVEVELIVPDGSSITKAELKYMFENLNGGKTDIAFITLLSLSTNKTSIGKCIKKVWMELQGLSIRAWPFLNSFLPKRPFIRLKRVLAITTSSAKNVFFVLLTIFINNYVFLLGGHLSDWV